ncbi:hypothetical protein EYF80_034855 [Liparis tanakae]|uniref:Secreted protein n=1 Tax=Liparis tanakae TaxID=230148 RepID=A0A4Z2GNW5_9TELE|nr:hypothetical protein EYF80_034855 [Liparis tanakae]
MMLVGLLLSVFSAGKRRVAHVYLQPMMNALWENVKALRLPADPPRVKHTCQEPRWHRRRLIEIGVMSDANEARCHAVDFYHYA